MKRTNPNTNQPFKRGDIRDDGYIFYNYTARLKANGFFMERWLSPDASEKAKSKDRNIKKSKYQRKTERHSPGFETLTASQKATSNRLRELSSEWVEYGDLTLNTVAEDLMGYEIDAGPELEAAIHHAGQLAFDAREAFRISLSL
jgi:hypothetical protein